MDRSVGYLVHNLNDPAVERRVAMLLRGGLSVQLAGFYREAPLHEIAGQRAVPLQQSHDGRLLHRARLVLGQLARPGKLGAALAPTAVLMARNLEMLALAVRVRRSSQRLIYESLDIHRTLLRQDALGAAMRRLERSLLARCDAVVTSSPAYAEQYFHHRQGYRGPIGLVENKLAAQACAADNPLRRVVPARPWRIGWFGMLRCRRSLAIFRRLVQLLPGQVEVHIAGIVSPRELPELEQAVAETPGLVFTGRYRPEDLPALYAGVHFAWCVDYFEEGLNARWALANRLYESVACGSVPLAAEGVEAGAWLLRNGVGLALADPEQGLFQLLASLTMPAYAVLKRDVLDLPLDRVAETPDDARALADCLAGLAP